jgi:hypothetical protein
MKTKNHSRPGSRKSRKSKRSKKGGALLGALPVNQNQQQFQTTLLSTNNVTRRNNKPNTFNVKNIPLIGQFF